MLTLSQRHLRHIESLNADLKEINASLASLRYTADQLSEDLKIERQLYDSAYAQEKAARRNGQAWNARNSQPYLP